MRWRRGSPGSRRPRAAGLVGVAMTLAFPLAVLSGCDRSSPSPSGPGDGAGHRPVTPATAPAGFGAVFLAVGECSSFGTTSFTEVSCGSERAAARVLARYDGKAADGPLCPVSTDFVLHIATQRAPGTGTVPEGYACMRDLEGPHPGDPGRGGGPRTVPGDCVYATSHSEVRETACDGSGAHPPEFRVERAVTRRSDCPATTELYVQIGGGEPIGCARPLTRDEVKGGRNGPSPRGR